MMFILFEILGNIQIFIAFKEPKALKKMVNRTFGPDDDPIPLTIQSNFLIAP